MDSNSLNLSRRQFLKTSAAVAVATSLPGWFLEREQALAAVAPKRPGPNDVDKDTLLINNKALTSWVKRYKDALNEFPAIRDKILQTGKLQARVDEFAGMKMFADEESISGIASSIYKADNPVKILQSVKRIVSKNPQAMDGLRKGMWEQIFRDAETLDKFGISLYPFQQARQDNESTDGHFTGTLHS